MTRGENTVLVVVPLTPTQAAVLARAAVVVTSALDCKDANAAEHGLLLFRQEVARAVSNGTAHDARKRPEPISRLCRRAGQPSEGCAS
ncbi:hypothetical protein SAMN05216553_102297 [Lentzea fradiae]|uniref:Uncharacterized protein n=1 Tax=Lentzea fradiae TaxID=200378 RepID=A0A1G7MGS3_9PSEU|nr:hypothetical protein [Lentzea fradiae]SDF60883.1 hypothetical protein SAMN05216553_102297 [Lentzea fradiae]